MGAKQSAEMTRALKLIIRDGKTAAEASRITGISKGAISQNAEYRAHIDGLVANFRKPGVKNAKRTRKSS